MTHFPFQLPRQFIGFEDLMNELDRVGQRSSSSNYPPCNIIKVDDESYTIELAVAGMDKDFLDITQDGNTLLIEYSPETEPEEADNYIHKGISNRSFKNKYTLGKFVEVIGAELDNGILTIELQRNIPDEQKPRKIKLGKTVKNEPELLTEDN